MYTDFELLARAQSRTEFLSQLSFTPLSIWHVKDLSKGAAGERAPLHRGDVSLKEKGLTFNHWNPLHLKIWPSVDFRPCHPSRSRRASGLCSPEVWPAFTLQGLRHLPAMLKLILGPQDTYCCLHPRRETAEQPCCIIQQRHSSRRSEKGSPFVVWSLLTLPHVLWFKCFSTSLSLMSSHALFYLNPLKTQSHFPFFPFLDLIFPIMRNT